VRDEARKYLGEAKSGDGKKLPEISELVRMKGDVKKGALVFKNYCTACHQVGENGMDYGPKLTQIGGKLTKEAIYSSIFHPDLGISFGYEGWDITLKDGTVMSGIIASKTETDIILKMPGGVSQNIKTSNIKTIKQLENSVMPAGLQEGMSTQELVDMVEYLKSLK
jgi:putative heme-binding domain-containing protein